MKLREVCVFHRAAAEMSEDRQKATGLQRQR